MFILEFLLPAWNVHMCLPMHILSHMWICMRAGTHVYVCICVMQLPNWGWHFLFLYWGLCFWKTALRLCLEVNGLAPFPAVTSFHFPLGALSCEHGFSHFLLLVSALFASLLPKNARELLKWSLDCMFNEWRVQRDSYGDCTWSSWSLFSSAGPWLTCLTFASADVTTMREVGLLSISQSLWPFHHHFVMHFENYSLSRLLLKGITNSFSHFKLGVCI
jgi:hypothetical protein